MSSVSFSFFSHPSFSPPVFLQLLSYRSSCSVCLKPPLLLWTSFLPSVISYSSTCLPQLSPSSLNHSLCFWVLLSSLPISPGTMLSLWMMESPSLFSHQPLLLSFSLLHLSNIFMILFGKSFLTVNLFSPPPPLLTQGAACTWACADLGKHN